MKKDFIEYCEKHVLLILLTFIIIFVCHGYILNNSNVGIDTEIFLNNPQNNYNWLEIGRFGLIIEKYILNLGFFNMFYAEALAIFLIFIFNLLCYYTFYVFSGKDFKYLNLIIPLVGFTSPIWAEQFVFYIQIAEIAFAMIVTVLAVLLIFDWVINKKKLSGIFGLVLLVLSIGTYQSFIPVYIGIVVFSLILLFENEEYKGKLDNILIIILKLMGSFIVGFIIYELILKITNVDFSYLNGSNLWRISSSKREVVKNIYYHIKDIILAKSYFYNLGLIVSLVLFIVIGIIKSIKNENNTKKVFKVIYFFAYAAFAATPFLMTVYIGQGSVVRAEIYIPLLEAMAILFVLVNYYEKVSINALKAIILVPVIYLFFVQSYYLERLYYTDYLTREKDKEYIYELAHDLKEAGVPDTATLFIYGHYNGMETNATLKGQVIGTSMFEFNHVITPMYYYSGQTIVYLFRAYGFNYNWLQIDRIDEAKNKVSSEEYPCWPKEGYINKFDGDDYYTIKINMY